MKTFLIIWGASLLIILFLGIYYMVGGNPNASGLLYEICLGQLFLLVAFIVYRKRKTIFTRI